MLLYIRTFVFFTTVQNIILQVRKATYIRRNMGYKLSSSFSNNVGPIVYCIDIAHSACLALVTVKNYRPVTAVAVKWQLIACGGGDESV